MSRLIDDFKNKISSYDKDYKFSQEEVLEILERYEIKYRNAQEIPLDKVKQTREEIIGESFSEYCRRLLLDGTSKGCIRIRRQIDRK